MKLEYYEKPDDRNQARLDRLSRSQAMSNTIDNYYGAHKNYKTSFRNKRYKEVYEHLSHRRPSQPEHMRLYFQDLLVTIIKTVEMSFEGNENHIQSAVPFFYFGTKAIKEFYWLFLKQRMIVSNQIVIDPAMSGKISYFFTLIIDFSAKMAEHLKRKGDLDNSERIYSTCYHKMAKEIIDSSTKDTRLLKKTADFLLSYAVYRIQLEQWTSAKEILYQALLLQLNCLILLNFKYEMNPANNSSGRSRCQRYQRKSLKKITIILLCMAVVAQKQQKHPDCCELVLDAVAVERLGLREKLSMKKWMVSFGQRYEQMANEYCEMRRVCCQFFDKAKIEQLVKLKICIETNPTLRQKQHPIIGSTTKLQDKKRSKFVSKKSILSVGRWAFASLLHKSTQQAAKPETKKIKEGKGDKVVRFKLNEQKAGSESKKKQNNSIVFRDSASVIRTDSNFDSVGSLCKNQLSSPVLLDPSMLHYEAIPQSMRSESYISESKRSNSSQTRIQKVKKPSIQVNVPVFTNPLDSKFLMFDDKFWQIGPSASSTTANKSQSLSKTRNRSQSRSFNRRLSYDNIRILQAQTLKNRKATPNDTNLQRYLKENPFASDVGSKEIQKGAVGRGVTKKKKIALFEQKSTFPDSYKTVNRKISEWHNKNTKIDGQIEVKLCKLKQRSASSKLKDEQFTPINSNISQNYTTKANNQKAKNNNNKASVAQAKNKKQQSKTNPLNIFRTFIVEHAEQLGVTKPEIFAIKDDIQPVKQRASDTGHVNSPEIIDSYIQKQHKITSETINFFLKEYESILDIKQIEHKPSKSTSWKKTTKNHSILKKHSSHQLELSIQDRSSSNLFISSLNERADNLIKYM